MNEVPVNLKEALRLAIDAINNISALSTRIYGEATDRNLNSYQLLLILEKVLKDKPTKTFWCLIIEHKHSRNISVYKSEQTAWYFLHEYCSNEWDDGLTEQYGDPNNLNQREVIEAYFDACGHGLDTEWYILKKFEV